MGQKDEILVELTNLKNLIGVKPVAGSVNFEMRLFSEPVQPDQETKYYIGAYGRDIN